MGDVTQSQDIWKPLMIYVIAAAYSAGALSPLAEMIHSGMDVTVLVPFPSPRGSYHSRVICKDKETLPCLTGFAFSPFTSFNTQLVASGVRRALGSC